MIFDIQRFSTHDGPGIRSIVFFKGCPLRCAWCENPESQSFLPELLYKSGACVGCGSCLAPSFGGVMSAPEGPGKAPAVRRDLPVPAGFGSPCPSLALRLAGKEMDAASIVEEVLRDEAFFRKSGGGVTLSGGEPLAQAALSLEIAKELLARGIDVAVESSLAVPRAVTESFATLALLWLVDLKHIDAEAFRKGTGGELAPILANLEYLAASGAAMVLRVPVIPGFNADRVRDILAYASGLGGRKGLRLDLLPYHDLAAGKYQALGRSYPYPRGMAVDRARLAEDAAYGASLGLEISIGG